MPNHTCTIRPLKRHLQILTAPHIRTTMSNEDDLTASHWDDVYTSPVSTGLPNILQSDEFAPPKYDSSPETSPKSDRFPEHDSPISHPVIASPPLESPSSQKTSQLGDYNDIRNPAHPSTLHSPLLADNASTEGTKSVDDGRRSALLLLLTRDADDPLSAPPVAPTSSEAPLFGPNSSGPNVFSDLHQGVPLSQPVSAAPPKRLFKGVRKAKSAPVPNPLAPEPDQNPQPAPSAPSKADELVRRADEPLYKTSTPERAGAYFAAKLEEERTNNVPEKPEPASANLNVSVGDPTKVGDITLAHILYSVRSSLEDGIIPEPEAVVLRRYTDFRWLYHQLQANHPGVIVPPPPTKQAVGRFNEQFVESRRAALERMVQKIAANAILQKDEDFILFLTLADFSNASKERERITGLGALREEEDSGGFISALGGAFLFQTKVPEPDPFFREQKAYVEDLEMHLKAFQRNFDTIVTQRGELATATGEFAKAVEALAGVEASKLTSDLLAEFSHTNQRIKELLERQNMQDLVTLGAVLDEYIRLLGLIKAVFSQRHKLLVASVNAESENNKKQTALEKFTRNHRNQVDKLEMMKREAEAYERKATEARKKFDDIGNTVKKELKKFEFEKVDDFRSSVETFLEGLIESQKEAIELWETFYDRQKLGEVDDVTLK